MAIIRLSQFGTSVSGKAGNCEYITTQYSTVLRDRTYPKNPQTPAQQEARMRLRIACRAWEEMEPEHIANWRLYAESLARRDPRTAQTITPRPMNLFTANYTRLLQLDIEAAPPLDPPTSPFFGDTISVSVSGGPHLITFTASGPNSANISTELLAQRLVNRHRLAYDAKFRTQGFASFAAGHLSVDVPFSLPAWFACAYRFVNTSTGQASPLVRCGVVQATG